MTIRTPRRAALATLGAAAVSSKLGPIVHAAEAVAFSYPVAWPDRVPGDGFYVKHGYGCENAVSYPGLTHTGENWYGSDRDADGAAVLACAAGTVVFADYDYPGRVVIVQHAPELYSMYGHMAYELTVETAQTVRRGQRLGSVLRWPDDPTRSHLHFELRTFLYSDRINGEHPSYGFTCGYECAPGPGYWPLAAPEHPSDLGWRNPTHVIGHRMLPLGAQAAGIDVVATEDVGTTVELWSDPPWGEGSTRAGDLEIAVGDRLALVQVAAGAQAARDRDASGYRLAYRLLLPGGARAWVRAATPAADAMNADGAPAAVRYPFVPVVGV
jgi:hypothetical protein